MNVLKLISTATLALALSASAQAQFSVNGGGSAIPASPGTYDGDFPPAPVILPDAPAIVTVSVPTQVLMIDSIELQGLNHAWAGDMQMTLKDPNGVEHLIFVRPGSTGGTSYGSSDDLSVGDYTFVETGGLSLPSSTTGSPVLPGTYNQNFSTGGGFTWTSGDGGIVNTPLSMITGPAGIWTLTVYDWFQSADSGSFNSWTLNGNSSGGPVPGNAYCFGDSTGANCPCSAFGSPGEGCATTSGSGALLAGTGNADVASDSFTLSVSGAPANKPGIFFQGTSQLSVPAGDGILCSNATKRYSLNSTDASGATTQSGFGAFASSGTTLNYQYWFRDPANTCGGGGFNFSNGWVVSWN